MKISIFFTDDSYVKNWRKIDFLRAWKTLKPLEGAGLSKFKRGSRGPFRCLAFHRRWVPRTENQKNACVHVREHRVVQYGFGVRQREPSAALRAQVLSELPTFVPFTWNHTPCSRYNHIIARIFLSKWPIGGTQYNCSAIQYGLGTEIRFLFARTCRNWTVTTSTSSCTHILYNNFTSHYFIRVTKLQVILFPPSTACYTQKIPKMFPSFFNFFFVGVSRRTKQISTHRFCTALLYNFMKSGQSTV